jgi:hypothetical protein
LTVILLNFRNVVRREILNFQSHIFLQ